MKIYSITKVQLIICWVFAVISFFAFGTIGEDLGFEILAILMFVIPFLVIFYTAGWYAHNKKNKD